MSDARGPKGSEFRIDSVDPAAMKTLAVMIDDPNPIHLYPEAAAEAGFGERTVNQGGANIGYVLNALAEVAPGAEIERVSFTLGANVFAGDEAVARATPKEDPAPGGMVECEVTLDVTGGERAIEGAATLKLPESG